MKGLANTTSRTPNTQYIATRDGSLKSNWLIEKHHGVLEKLQVSILHNYKMCSTNFFGKSFTLITIKALKLSKLKTKTNFP